jgi:hypothetical protein
MKHVKLFEQFINESSTLTGLGISDAAIGAYYKHEPSSSYSLDANATYSSSPNKKTLEQQIKDGGLAPKVIFVLDGQGGMTVASMSNDDVLGSIRPEYGVFTIKGDGSREVIGGDLTFKQAIAKLPRAKVYYFSTSASATKKTSLKDARTRELDEVLSNIMSSSFKILRKDIEQLVQEYKAKALELMQAGDTQGALETINSIMYDKRRGYGQKEMTELDLEAILHDRRSNTLLTAFQDAMSDRFVNWDDDTVELRSMIMDYKYGEIDSLEPIKKKAYQITTEFLRQKRKELDSKVKYNAYINNR